MAPLNLTSAVVESLARPDVLILISVVAVAGYVLYERFLAPCAGIPGPFFASLSRWWMIKHSLDGDMNRVMIQLHEKYGPLVRTGPSELSISDLSAIRKIYGMIYRLYELHDRICLQEQKDLALSSGNRHGTVFSRATASLIYFQSRMKISIALKGSS